MVIKLNKVAYEDALTMSGFGKFNWLMFALCSSIITAMVFELYSVSYLVPASVCELVTTSTQQGLMAGLPLFGVIATSHLWGYLADTHGRRKMLCLSMTIGYFSGSLAALSPNWITLSVLKFLSSASVSGASALAVTLLGECTPAAKRGTVLLLATCAFLTCTGVMAVISIPVLPLTFSYYIPILNIHFNSWRLLNLIYSLPCALNAIGAACAYESPKYLLSVGKDDKALEVLKGIFAINSGKSGELYQVNTVELDEDSASLVPKSFWASISSQTVVLFKPPLLKNTLLLSIISILVYVCVNPFVVWLPLMVDAFMTTVDKGEVNLTICQMIRLTQNTSTIGQTNDCTMINSAMVMVFGVSMILAVVNAVISLALNLIGKRRSYIGIQILSGVAALCITFTSIWPLSAILFIILLVPLLNFGFITCFTVDLFPTYVKAKAVCLMLMMGRGITILGINVLKNLLDNNCEVAFYIFGVLTIAGGLIGFLLPPDQKLNPPSKSVQLTK